MVSRTSETSFILPERFLSSQFREQGTVPPEIFLFNALKGVKAQIWAMDSRIFVSGTRTERELPGSHYHDVSLYVPKTQKAHMYHLLKTFSVKRGEERVNPNNQDELIIPLGKIYVSAKQIRDLSST